MQAANSGNLREYSNKVSIDVKEGDAQRGICERELQEVARQALRALA